MVPVTSLWLPILLSAVIVFVVSALIHMVLTYHRSDFGHVPSEDAVMNVLRSAPPGDYMFPWGEGPSAMKDPAFIEKMKKGPVGVLTLLKPRPPSMGPSLARWFVYCIVVGIFAAYIAGRALGPGAPKLSA
jgi:hypothetical protein